MSDPLRPAAPVSEKSLDGPDMWQIRRVNTRLRTYDTVLSADLTRSDLAQILAAALADRELTTESRDKIRAAIRHIYLGNKHQPITRDDLCDFANTGISRHDHEVWRIRNKPELYDEWHVDFVNTQRLQYVNSLNTEVEDWDCPMCEHAVLTPKAEFNANTKCPNCGW